MEEHLLKDGGKIPLAGNMAQFVKVGRDYHGCHRMGGLVTVDRPVNVDRISEAVRILEKRHPRARCVLVDWDLLQEVSSEFGVIPVVEVERKDNNTVVDIWQEDSVRPIELGSSPFRIFVVNGSTKSEILITADHHACDGISLMAFAHEIFLTVENPNVHWEERPILPEYKARSQEVFPCCCPRIYGYWKAISGLLQLVCCGTKAGYVERSSGLESCGLKSRDYTKPCVLSRGGISKDDFTKLRKIARDQYNVNVNPVILVAIFRALAGKVNPKKGSSVVASVPVNLRPLFNQALDSDDKYEPSDLTYVVGNYMASSNMKSSLINDPQALWQEAVKIQKHYENLDPTQLLAGGLISDFLLKMGLPIEAKGIITTMVTNVGKSPLKTSYNNLGNIEYLDAFLSFTGTDAPAVCLTGFNGELRFTVFAPQYYLNQTDIDEIKQDIELGLRFMLSTQDNEGDVTFSHE